MRGFGPEEYRSRVLRAQTLMVENGLAALLLTTEPEVRYFTGFLTRFWESPTRPWFVVVPAAGDPIAVIPSIGGPVMARTWITDIRTWRSPDLTDDGISLLSETLVAVAGDAPVGTPMGHETHLRMPLADYTRLSKAVRLLSDEGIMRSLRMVKSDAEIAKIRTACDIAGRAFARVHEFARPGAPLSEVFRRFQMTCLEEGADWVPYLAGGAGPMGYDDVISPARDTPLAAGDVLMLDTGLVHDGYSCDYDRNFGIGATDQRVRDTHARLIEATQAAYEAARPGATAADLFHAMDKILTGGAGGSDAGRYGHGLGMQLTEWPSLIPNDHTVLQPGMVLTLEPGMTIPGGQYLVHEENIVVRDGAAERLSRFSGPALTEI
ncbi:Xaa-Pro peptidase family protein [Loktanella sp. IMCC34160]|uniref:M24 family metallopeptidase n=1 Tax=Loktanella sp. IMCC34160 TaxID=2510646 RepID=UPI001A937352|nr:Xaa-Pro peptidase family protein [Loktanella sp. IMCC34160]